jgi:hypothetical protein
VNESNQMQKVVMDRRLYVAAGTALTVVSGLVVLACAIYCIVWWPKPTVPALLILDVALTCWLYCGTLQPVWGSVAVLSGILLMLAGIGLWLGRAWARGLALVFGVLTLPVGVLALYASFSTEGERSETDS